jgi:hypothetical protein
VDFAATTAIVLEMAKASPFSSLPSLTRFTVSGFSIIRPQAVASRNKTGFAEMSACLISMPDIPGATDLAFVAAGVKRGR